MNIYTKEHSRAYSLLRLDAWHISRTKWVKKISGHSMLNDFFAAYEGGDLVDAYYNNEKMQKMIKIAFEMCKDKNYILQLIKEFADIFQELKPFFVGEKIPNTIDELKRLHDIYAHYWSLVAFVVVVTWNKDADEELKKKATESRELTQEYNESIERIYEQYINKNFPRLKNNYQFILPHEIWADNIDYDKLMNNINKRKKGYVWYDRKIYTGRPIPEILKKLGIEVIFPESKDVKGQSAFGGKITGKVKIITKPEDNNKVEEGDILVTPMTLPTYIPAMKRAGAFITDEGGITCHAAIMAREMKKPCIIGTKNATKVLKDGDLIQVDADKGIVKKIK